MPNRPKTTIRGIRVPDEEWDDFKAAASANGSNASGVARELFAEYVEAHTDRETG